MEELDPLPHYNVLDSSCWNKTGFGPMGTGGDTTALAVHVDFSAGHGFVPVAVCFNCWINRRTAARIYDSGEVVRLE